MNYCPNCGKTLQVGMTQCPNCGQSLTPTPMLVQAERQRSIFWPIVGALLFVFVVLPLLFMLLFAGCAGCASLL